MKPPIRALSAGLLTAGIALTTVATPAIAAPPTPPSTPSSTVSGASGSDHTVTLITGDVVTLHQSAAGNTATVVSPTGQPSDAQIMELNGQLSVYPKSAIRYVAAGVLDKRLFNVSELVADGYDDAARASLPLIVTYGGAASDLSRRAVPAGAQRVATFSSVNGASLNEERATSAAFWSSVTGGPGATARGTQYAFGSDISKIWLDGKVTATLADSTAQIGAPEVWGGGDTGQGVTVAVLDTGIDTEHPDFAGRIAATQSFVPDESIDDWAGHGSHVASTIAGTGAASGGKESGVAPGAMLDVGKVLDDNGSGMESWILAGMEWATREKHAKIVSMSLGGSATDGTDPMSAAVDALTAETGALFVIAAGNEGSTASIGAPGAATSALTVGAVDSHDDIAYFSSRGPRLRDGLIKPEITAPGVDILAAHSHFKQDGLGSYWTLSGTSMATPHVAGAAALVLQAHPELTAAQLKDELVSTSHATPQLLPYDGGNGRVDAAASVKATVFATGTISVQRADADPQGTVTQPVTYTNVGDKPVTLALTIDPGKSKAGVFALSATSVTVPAHGTASVSLISTVTNADTLAVSAATVVASLAGSPVARTAAMVSQPTHRFTANVKDRFGQPAYGTIEVVTDAPEGIYLLGVDGSGWVDLATGVYSMMMLGEATGVHGDSSLGIAFVGNPDLAMDRDRTVDFDLSKVKQIDNLVPKKTATTFQRLDYYRKIGDTYFRSTDGAQQSYDSMWTAPTAKVTHGEFDLDARTRKEDPEFTLASGGHDYSDLRRQLDTTRLPDGAAKLGLVYAGSGAPEDYTGLKVKGKAVVVHNDPNVGTQTQAAAAAAAGAKLLIAVNDALGITIRNYGTFLDLAPIEVVGISKDEGDLLIAQAAKPSAKVEITSKEKASYVYDLMQSHKNQTPQSLITHEDSTTLASITEDFSSAPKGPQGGGEFRYDFPVFNNWGVGATDTRPIADKRTDWVTVSDRYTWGQMAFVTGAVVERAPEGRYLPGSLQKEVWYRPIIRPYLNNAYRAPERTDDSVYIDIPGFGGGNHMGAAQSTGQTQSVALYQGSTLIDSKDDSSFIDVGGLPDAAAAYRFVTKTTQEGGVGGTATSTSTQWNFTSVKPTAENTAATLPMIQLNYTTDANAKGVIANESTITITPQQFSTAVGAGTLGKPTVALSYDDGKTWRSATVSKSGKGSWQVSVEALLHTKFVSIRTDLADSKGNSVSQTVIRALGVK